jgi:excisionase family DNA binding protein
LARSARGLSLRPTHSCPAASQAAPKVYPVQGRVPDQTSALVDPGPHERVMTVREIAARLGVCTALVYRLCQRNELLALRIGGALRFHRETVASFVGRPSGDCPPKNWTA